MLIERVTSLLELYMFFTDALYFADTDVFNALVLLLRSYDGKIDDKIFACIRVFLLRKESTFDDIAFINEIAFPRCSQCEKQYWTQSFVFQNKKHIYERCSRCRGKNANAMDDYSILQVKD